VGNGSDKRRQSNLPMSVISPDPMDFLSLRDLFLGNSSDETAAVEITDVSNFT
jgi:hypothetical protein